MTGEWFEGCFGAFGAVRVKRMFGGQGVWIDGMICALIVDDELLLKVDAASAPAFEAEGCKPWVYARAGRADVTMPYWSVPDGALDDPDAFAPWARLAFEAALRAHQAKAGKKPARKG